LLTPSREGAKLRNYFLRAVAALRASTVFLHRNSPTKNRKRPAARFDAAGYLAHRMKNEPVCRCQPVWLA